jgi:hypothetical protein
LIFSVGGFAFLLLAGNQDCSKLAIEVALEDGVGDDVWLVVVGVVDDTIEELDEVFVEDDAL